MYEQQWQPYTPVSSTPPPSPPPASWSFEGAALQQTSEWPRPGSGWVSHQEHAAIAVTLRYSPLTLLLGLFTPVLAVDGQPVAAGWKRPIVVPVVPGRHHLHVHVPYLIPRRIGKADLDVAVLPGQTAALEYRAPTIAWMRGALGGPPQKYPGTVATIVLLVFTMLMAFCAVGNAIVAASAETRSVPAWAPTPGRTIPSLPPVSSSSSSSSSSGGPALPSFAAADETSAVRFEGWPFGFRTPAGWDCVDAKVEVDDAEAFICSGSGGDERVGVMLRSCAPPCDEASTARMTKDWFTAVPERVDDSTHFLESEEGDRYQLELDHFFGGPKWQVGVVGTAPAESRDAVRKVADDILRQAS
ncbi:hypothetical protein [Actinoplanes sp. NPDC023714]|uniref:hypothetical protein n=1 Tax=Actinoplanes sp. NPDC023714 TaxID=3154322 RepID=UPI003403CE73